MKLLLAFAGIVLVTALLVWVKARTHEAQAESSFPPEGQFVDVDGTRVHAVVRGAPEAPPLVLIHGASGNTRDWTLDIVPRLATSYRVIVFDRPGLGYTDSSRGSGAGGAQTISEQATLLQAAAETLGDDKPDIKVPVEVLHGTADMLVWSSIHSEPLARAIPDATLTLLPGTGHMPHHAVPDEITDAIHRAFARAGIVEPFNARP